MTGERRRLVITQNRNDGEHISSVILAADEVTDHLELEARMHELQGWHVDRLFNTVGHIIAVRCEMGDIVRDIEARLFDPMTDNPNKEGSG